MAFGKVSGYTFGPSRRPTAATLTAAVCIAGVLAVALSQHVGAANTRPIPLAGASPGATIRSLLHSPSHLRLIGSSSKPHTFFFRMEASGILGQLNYGLVAVCRRGTSAVLVYGSNGLPYAYCSGGLLVFVDLRRPGTLDVYRGISPGLAIGGGPAHSDRLMQTSFLLAPTVGRIGMIDLNLRPWVESANRNAARKELVDHGRQIVFEKGLTTLRVSLGPKDSSFPIGAVVVANPKKGRLSIWDISANAQPLRKFFEVNLKALENTGVSLRVRNYQVRPLLWFPPANFGKVGGEVRAAEALARLMPINPARLRASRARWMGSMLNAVRRSTPGTPTEQHPRLNALARIYKTVEWGSSGSINEAAMKALPAGPHRGLDWHWNFSRAKYHRKLERTWGRKATADLVDTLKTVAVGPSFGPAEKFMALDLLSDIGPDRTDADWGSPNGFLAHALAAARNPVASDAFVVSTFSARWGVPLSPGEIAAARAVLLDQGAGAVVRLRALEVLCFTNRLPPRAHIIVPLVAESLRNQVACLVQASSGRFLFDLSLCRTGRAILLHQLVDRHSQLADQPLLPVAAFNRPWPGSPGYKIAAGVAARIVNDLRYSPHVRHQAFDMILKSPWPIYQRYMKGRLGSKSGGFGWKMVGAISMRKAALAFGPLLTSLFNRGSLTEKEHILLAVGFGVPPGTDADSFAPLIKSALKSGRSALCWAGINCIQHLRVGRAQLKSGQLYPFLLALVRGRFADDSAKGPALLNVFSSTTDGGWQIPVAGLSANHLWPEMSWAGKIWWREHYAAVRASALRWAAAHPDYPKAGAAQR